MSHINVIPDRTNGEKKTSKTWIIMLMVLI